MHRVAPYCLIVGLVFSINILWAQAPDTLWERCYGGTYQDQAQSIRPTPDGGSIVLGTTGSNGHDVKGNHGQVDIWVLKLDKLGRIEWQKCLGGRQDDWGWGNIELTNDKGYIVCGYTYSRDTLGSEVKGNHGLADYWVVKLDDTGSIQWEKCFGGIDLDAAYSVKQTRDGGFIVAGSTQSNTGEIDINHGLIDAWILKLSNSGGIQWKYTYGGTGYDGANCIIQTSDGGFAFAGYTTSADSDLAGRHFADTANTDLWVERLDSNGKRIWSNWYGGTGEEEANAIKQTPDGGFIVTGYTTSNDGDVKGYHDSGDCWLIHIDGQGKLLWQKCLGGSGRDTANDVALTRDRGFIVGGFTTSNDFDVKGNHGNKDMWVVKVDSVGNVKWQKCLGGTKSDGAFSVANCGDSAILLAGWSYTENNGDVHGHHNLSFPPGYDIDVWVVKLASYPAQVQEEAAAGNFKVSPNPANSYLDVDVLPEGVKSLTLFNELGREVYRAYEPRGHLRISAALLPPGIYLMEVKAEQFILHKKILIQR